MGTRGVIARPISDTGWRGIYHHWDSYPTGLGATLWNAYHGYFDRNIKAMTAYLIDAHPGGWSTVVDTDFTQAVGFDSEREVTLNPLTSKYEPNPKWVNRPQCYCHGERSENRDGAEDWSLSQTGDIADYNNFDIEWVYILHKHGMDILTQRARRFEHVALVPWNGEMPDWHEIESRG